MKNVVATAEALEQRYRISTSALPIECPICQFTVRDGEAGAFNDVCWHMMDQHDLTCTLSRTEADLKPGFRHTVADFR